MTLDQVDTTVVTTTPTPAGARRRCRPTSAPHARAPAGSEMIRRIVVLAFGLIQAVIGLRIVLLLLDAREANALVAAILNVSQVFVAPFEGILRMDSLGIVGFSARHRGDRRARRLDAHRAGRPVGRGHLPARARLRSGARRACGVSERDPSRDNPVVAHPRVATTKGTEPMGIISWIVVGAIAGFLANLVMGSKQGLVMMIVLGIVGGLVGGFIATSVLGMGEVDGFNLESILIATLGAILVVAVVGFVNGSRRLGRA